MVTIVSEWWIRVLMGLIGSSVIGYAAYTKKSLSRSGMWAAIVMGTGFAVLGEPIWFTLLIAFFVSSTAWSKWKSNTIQKSTAELNYEKGGQRDAWQVWANGGIGLLLCIGSVVIPHEAWLFAYVGVMATVTADTWATEIGSLSKGKPISIVTWKPVPTGTSGGISWLGSLAALAGASFIGLIGSSFYQLSIPMLLCAAIGGFTGAMADSYIGARWQIMYKCHICKSKTERTVHCQIATEKASGYVWCNNDAVNVISSVIGGCVAMVLLLQ